MESQQWGSLLCNKFKMMEPRAGDAAAPAAPEAAALPRQGRKRSCDHGIKSATPFSLSSPTKSQSHGISCAARDPQGPSSPTPDPAQTPQQSHPVPESVAQRLLELRQPWAQLVPWKITQGMTSAPHHQCQAPGKKGRGAVVQRRGEGKAEDPVHTQLPHCCGNIASA